MREVVAPTAEPLTLEEVRVHLRLENVAVSPAPPAMNNEELAWCTAKITAARQWAEDFLGFPLTDATYVEGFDEFEATLSLPNGATTVTSVQYLDAFNMIQTMASLDYAFDSFSGSLYVTGSIPNVSERARPVRVQFKGPLVTTVSVPERVKHALLLMIGHWHENREAVLVGSAAAELPLAVESLLRPLRTRMAMA